jgi:hypothetical protein
MVKRRKKRTSAAVPRRRRSPSRRSRQTRGSESENKTASPLAAYGITDFDENSVFAASQCLFEDRDGEVYVDLMFTRQGDLRFASLPIGVNAARLRAQQAMLTAQ